MSLTRRGFLELSAGSLVYGFAFACGGPQAVEVSTTTKKKIVPHALRYFVDYTEWIFFHPDGSVTAHTGRTELGQGLQTILTNLISQGLEIPPDRLQIVMGDTASCPDDGPTEGSSATRIVAWGYWHACERIRHDLVRRAAERLGCAEAALSYADAGVVEKSGAKRRVEILEMVDERVQMTRLEPTRLYGAERHYVDRATLNVNAIPIVTGTQVFAGDLFPGECEYGAFLTPPYHVQMTRVDRLDLAAARRREGVVHADREGSTAFAVGTGFRTVQTALDAMNAQWSPPARSERLEVEAEIRAGAKLKRIIEERGNPASIDAGDGRISLAETYHTQYASQVPIETETAVAEVDGDEVRVWASTQAPFHAQRRTAEALGVPLDKVRIISSPVGGGFGVKVDTMAPTEAAIMARQSGRRVKHVYTREHQFVGKARYKEAVVADISSVVGADGTVIARTLDLYQDEGFGSKDTYDIPNVRTRLFRTRMPARHGTMRGTSFVQTCFAVESHTDMLARATGLDPVEFRKRNLALPAFAPLLDACAEMLGFGVGELALDHGHGFAICHHGGRQLGAVGVEVAVDRRTGVVSVENMAGAFDIGLIINRNTVTAGVKSALLWGLGFALFEEVHVDGHRARTRSLEDYRIPRFSDVPPIEIAFLDNLVKAEIPRGIGELPVIPAIGAIANAVFDAIGIRFTTLPLTPERVLEALRNRP